MILTIVLYSPFETQEKVAARWNNVIDGFGSLSESNEPKQFFINDESRLDELVNKYLDSLSALILVVGSGGTERLALNAIKLTNCPVVLVANNQVNSLAAAIEINAIAKKTRPFKFVYIDNKSIAIEQIKYFLVAANALHKINSARFGLIGAPSPWLISSDGLKSIGSFKTKLVEIEIERLFNKYRKISIDEKENIANPIIMGCASKTVENIEVMEAGGVYLAMKSLIEEERLDGLTIRCFDLLQHKITACLGMAVANDNGIVASCEGDLHASFCMMLGSFITRGAVWMANPSSVCIKSNTLTLAHCTVPFSMLDKAEKPNLDTHMESQLSVAVEGALRKEVVTIFRTLSDFSGIFAVTGKIIDTNMGNKSLCRTQAVVKLDTDVEEWMQLTPGNHQILAYGNITHLLKDFCLISGLNLITR